MARFRKPLRLILIMITLSLASAGCLFACQKQPVDQERDAMVGTFEKVQKVLMQELSCSADRVMISSNLSLVGINEDNRMKVKSALEKEIGITIPENLLLERRTVGDIVRFAADRQLRDEESDRQSAQQEKRRAADKAAGSPEKKQSKDTVSKKLESKKAEPETPDRQDSAKKTSD